MCSFFMPKLKFENPNITFRLHFSCALKSSNIHFNLLKLETNTSNDSTMSFLTRQPEDFYVGTKKGSDFTKRFSYMTNMDLVETPSEYKVIADIPGVAATDLKVWLNDYDLFIDATRVDPFEDFNEREGEISRDEISPQITPIRRD